MTPQVLHKTTRPLLQQVSSRCSDQQSRWRERDRLLQLFFSSAVCVYQDATAVAWQRLATPQPQGSTAWAGMTVWRTRHALWVAKGQTQGSSRELTRKWLVWGKRRGAGRKQGCSVTRSLGTNLTASPTSYPTPIRQRIVANVGGSVMKMSNNLW